MKFSLSCRVCADELFEHPLLSYRGMPGTAQGFPDSATVAFDQGANLDVYQCVGCGLVQLPAEPVPYHREVIRAAGISRVLAEAKSRQFADFVVRHHLEGKKIVEVGCGRGEFLSLLSSLPVEAHGVEFGQESVRHCRAAGLRVSHGYPGAGSPDFKEAPFDAFLLLMFLEHMPDPNASLRFICRQLTPGAIGLIEVPNFDMMIKKHLFSEFISDHLLYFGRETFETTLRFNGFEIVDFSELRDDYVLSATVRKRSPLDLSEFSRSQRDLTAQLRSFVGSVASGRIAAWGAGHQALAVLALSGIAPSIRYVVDSAPFKQGKLTPATHLPIFSPETLRTDPVEAVIVMAASYSDEVVGILNREYKNVTNVAILREGGLEILQPRVSPTVA